MISCSTTYLVSLIEHQRKKGTLERSVAGVLTDGITQRDALIGRQLALAKRQRWWMIAAGVFMAVHLGLDVFFVVMGRT